MNVEHVLDAQGISMQSESLRVARSGVPPLTAWGASPVADLVFRFLAEHGPQSAETLRKALGSSRKRVLEALDELADIDAVTPGRPPSGQGPDARQWLPRAPEAAVAALRDRQHAAARAWLRTRSRLAAPSGGLDPDLTWTARPLHGLSRVRSRLAELVHATHFEHLSMHPEPAFDRATVQASASLDHDLLARKVSVLSLGVPPGVEDVTAAHTLELTHSGLRYRELPTLPAKIILFDRHTAILPIDPGDRSKGAFEVTAPAAVESLAAWFMRRWDAARPPAPTTAAVRLNERERSIVGLLAAGHTDATAAAQLGLSERTVAYAISRVMERYSVLNRYQLGLVLGAVLPSRTSDDDLKEGP